MTLFAIILIIAGVFFTIAPNLVYAITQSWKNSNNSEPSRFYKTITRVQGVVLAVIGVVLIVS